VMAAWVWALTGDAPRARDALRIAESASFDGSLPDGSVSLESAVLRARAALAPDGVERMLADAERAVALEPPGSRWHTQASLLLGSAHLVNGHAADAVRWFEQAARFGREEQRPGALTALAEHALLAAERGDWRMAEVCLRDSVELREAGNLQGLMPTLTSYLAEARVALHRADTQLAIRDLQSALSLYESPSPVAFPWLAVQAAGTIAQLLLELGDTLGAERKIAQARRHLALLSPAGALPDWVDGLAAAVDTALSQSMVAEASTLTPAELRVLHLLPTHRSLAEIAEELVVSRNTVKSQVSAIYRKLAAENRSEAVSRAEANGLLRRWPEA
jgi:LuxR family maltose regulon positive regulatory protein